MKRAMLVAAFVVVAAFGAVGFAQDLSDNPIHQVGTDWLADPVENADADDFDSKFTGYKTKKKENE